MENPSDQERSSPGRKPARGMPIAFVLAAAIAVVVAVSVAVVYVAGYGVARRGAADLVRERAHFAIDTIIASTTRHLEPTRAQLAYIDEAIAAGDVRVEDRRALGDLLSASLAAAPQVSVAAFVYPDLTVLRALRARTADRIAMLNWRGDPDVAAAFDAARHAPGPYWGELFVAEEAGQAFINLRQPVWREGRFLGVLVAGVSVSELSGFLGRLPLGDTDRAFILRGNEAVLAHPNMANGVPGISDEAPLPGRGAVGDPVLAALWSAEAAVPLDFDVGNGLQARAVAVGGNEYVVLYQMLSGYGEPPWLVGTYVDLEAATAPLDRLDIIPRVGIAILALGLLVALLLGRRLSRPIRLLAHAAERIRALDIDGAPRLKTGHFAEINDAAAAYNAMVRALRSFETYVPRALVSRLVGDDGAGAIVSEEREVTVLFTDIVGFSNLAEEMSAPDLAALLNEHFTILGHAVEAEGGTIDKYIGDSVMAFWGAPDRQDDHAVRACRAVQAISCALVAMNIARAELGLEAVRLRIGVHSGKVVVGNIGSPSRINYTIVGDTVNIAERLEELARDFDDGEATATALASGATAALAATAGMGLEPLGERMLRGHQQPVAVWRLQTDGA